VGSSGLLSGGSITWGATASGDTIKARLVASSATVNQDDTVMTPWTQVTSTDQTLVNKSKATNTTDNRIQFTNSADIVWTAVASGTVRYVGIFKLVTNDADSIPIALIDITSCVANGSDITLPAQTALFYSQQ
jgi:hypothetical protein